VDSHNPNKDTVREGEPRYYSTSHTAEMPSNDTQAYPFAIGLALTIGVFLYSSAVGKLKGT
jgi:hypothetical protein